MKGVLYAVVYVVGLVAVWGFPASLFSLLLITKEDKAFLSKIDDALRQNGNSVVLSKIVSDDWTSVCNYYMKYQEVICAAREPVNQHIL